MISDEYNRSDQIKEELLDRLIAGEQEAFGSCYEILMPQIYRFLRSRMPSHEEAEDLVEHVFLKVWKTRKSYDKNKSSFRTWVFVITKRSLIDWYRTRKVDSSLIEATTKADESRIEEQIDHQLKMDGVRQALDKLDDKASEIIRLRYLSELSSKEVASILSLNESAVRVRLHRALKQLREHLNN